MVSKLKKNKKFGEISDEQTMDNLKSTQFLNRIENENNKEMQFDVKPDLQILSKQLIN